MWTYPPRSILVPVDFGTTSARALRVARTLAAAFDASITVMHAEAIDVPPYFTHDQLRDIERARAAAKREAERYLQAFADESAPGSRTRLLDGPPAAAILAVATDYDLVVMGTHGRRGPSRWWMGSTAERVVRGTAVPVIVVRPEADASDPALLFQLPVAVAGPGSGDAAHAYATGLATRFGGRAADQHVSSIGDLTCSPGASLMTVAIPPHEGGAWFGDMAERLLRQCELPMLFVPPPQ